jgi:AraC-like DNA-binding protein
VDNSIDLPEARRQHVWLLDETWEIPSFENADTFLDRLQREDLLAHEPIVEAVLANRPLDLSLRTVQRRFLRATGMTRGTLEQIQRAKEAVKLLGQGVSIADAVYYAGYADQPHLTRSLQHFMGQTPGQIVQSDQSE